MSSDKPVPHAEFLSQVSHALTTRDGVDVDVAQVLAKHLLTPGASSPERAIEAIRTLAAERVKTEEGS